MPGLAGCGHSERYQIDAKAIRVPLSLSLISRAPQRVPGSVSPLSRSSCVQVSLSPLSRTPSFLANSVHLSEGAAQTAKQQSEHSRVVAAASLDDTVVRTSLAGDVQLLPCELAMVTLTVVANALKAGYAWAAEVPGVAAQGIVTAPHQRQAAAHVEPVAEAVGPVVVVAIVEAVEAVDQAVVEVVVAQQLQAVFASNSAKGPASTGPAAACPAASGYAAPPASTTGPAAAGRRSPGLAAPHKL